MPFSPAFATTGFWEAERERLVTLCAKLSGAPAAADDLAQETLLEAWRHQDRLTDPTGSARWLSAIARNVCLRWQHRQSQEWHHTYQPTDNSMGDELTWEDRLADPLDIQTEVAQRDVRQLVARAVDHLAPTARAALVAHIVHDAPFAAIAQHLGLPEASARVQVHRAKRSLRRVLTTTLRAEAQACGLLLDAQSTWDETTLWCPLCGDHHLQGQWDITTSSFALRCPACYPATGTYCSYTRSEIIQGTRSFKVAFHRVMRWANANYRPALAGADIRCDCGTRVAIERRQSAAFAPQPYRGIVAHCPRCGTLGEMRLSNLALYTPEAWQFWQDHPRLRLLPERVITYQEQPALLISYQCVAESRQIDIITAQSTYNVLAIQTGSTQYTLA